jgi:hypothetical protein
VTALVLETLGVTVEPEVLARLLPCPPQGWNRPATKPQTKLQVAINQGGRCKATGKKLGDVKGVRFDHRPALWERPYDPEKNDTVPSVNDPKFIDAILHEKHTRRTFKDNGSGRGDVSAAAHVRRVSRIHAEHKQAMAEKQPGVPRKQKNTIPSRPNAWPAPGSRPLQSRGFR